MKIPIRNMVCNRCIMVVRQEFVKAGIHPASVNLGEVEVAEPVPKEKLARLNSRLRDLGFEILDNRTQKLIENIRHHLRQLVQGGEIDEHFVLSEFLSKKTLRDYPQISRLFSQVEGITIEQYFILQKVEKVKEWLVYNEYTLSEMAWKLGYSSVAHLSSQFRKVTGLTPTAFKSLGASSRRPIDEVNSR